MQVEYACPECGSKLEPVMHNGSEVRVNQYLNVRKSGTEKLWYCVGCNTARPQSSCRVYQADRQRAAAGDAS